MDYLPPDRFREELESALEQARDRLQTVHAQIKEANRRYGIRHADLVLVCDLPTDLQALNRQYRALEWQVDEIREAQSRVIVRPDGETVVLRRGHTFAGFSEDGKVITVTGGVVYDDDYIAAEEAHHQAQRAAIIEQYGSEEAYSEHMRAETDRTREHMREAFSRERIRRDRRGHRPAAIRLSPRRRERRPGATRRTASSSTTSSADPPGSDSDSDSPAPAILRVRRPSGIVQTFEADHLETDAGILWATGRWRRRIGLNYSEIRYSHPGTYGFGAGEIVEVRT